MPRKNYKKSDELQTQILDKAEKLFAQRGFYGVSVRDITNALDIRLGSINYHFGTKEKLFQAVIHRRIEPLSAERLKRLKKVDIDPPNATTSVRAIVEAFAGPMMEFANSGDEGWRDYCKLVAQVAAQPPYIGDLTFKEYDPVALKFIDAIDQTFPGLDEYRKQVCFQLLLGNMLYAVCDNKRIDNLSKGAFHSSDLASLAGPFYDYVTAGILACAKPS